MPSVSPVHEDPVARARHRKALVTEAIAGPYDEWIAIGATAVVFGVVVIASGLLFGEKLGSWIAFLLPAPALGVMAVAYIATDRALGRRNLARVRDIGHAFDAGPYLAQLAENRLRPVVAFTLWFDRVVADKELALAMRDKLPELASVELRGQRLVARTESLSGHALVTGSRSDVAVHQWTNRRVHTAVAQFVAEVIPLVRAYPIEKLEIAVEGETSAWDAVA